jgi:hypothetical protein
MAAPAASGVVLPLVIPPPSASNLNSLLTGHVSQESERAQEDGGIASKGMEEHSANDISKPPKKKESKKSKISKEGKKDKANKHD